MSYLALAARHWKLIGLGIVCLLLAVQTVRLGHRTNQLERQKIANNELRAELKAISDAKNEQKEITKDTIKDAEKGERDVQPIVKIIREAPLPENCGTPGLEILRNEI